MPLRYEILYRELGWTIGNITSFSDLYDEYDKASISFGIFHKNSILLAAGRLINPTKKEDLPSVNLLIKQGFDCNFVEPVAEISRILVNKTYRSKGLFRVLFHTGVLLACRKGIRSLIITERDDDRYAAFMAQHNFKRCANGFVFLDGKLNPREPAATYVLDITKKCRKNMEKSFMHERMAFIQYAEINW